ncbi:MAG: hypothetical protein Q4D98_00705 [Planctomycetia bacterium]|nr:hypothetical protein [Planctomycetia bacterium]
MKMRWAGFLGVCLGLWTGSVFAVNISGEIAAGTYSDSAGYITTGGITFQAGSVDTIYTTLVAGGDNSVPFVINNDVYFNGGLSHNSGTFALTEGSKSLNLVGNNENLRGRFRIDDDFTGNLNVGSETVSATAPNVDLCIGGGAVNYYVLSGETTFNACLADDARGTVSTRSFNKYGVGTLTLTRAGQGCNYGDGHDCPAFSGTINVREGTLKISGTGTLGEATTQICDNSILQLASTTTKAFEGKIVLHGYASKLLFSESATISGDVTGENSFAVEVAEGKTATISGNITKPDQTGDSGGTLAKYGTGKLVLSGENPGMKGRIRLVAGTLQIESGAHVQDHYRIDVDASTNATLNFHLSSTIENPYVWGTSINQVAGTSTMNLTSGVLQIGNASTDAVPVTIKGDVTASGNSTLVVSNGTFSATRLYLNDGSSLILNGGEVNLTYVKESGADPGLYASSGGYNIEINGGVLNVPDSSIGKFSTSTGTKTFTMTGGEVHAYRLSVNDTTFTMSGGTMTLSHLLSTGGQGGTLRFIGGEASMTVGRIAMTGNTSRDLLTFSATNTGLPKVVSEGEYVATPRNDILGNR